MLEFMSSFFESKDNYKERRLQELFKAYKWIRENNHNIPDDILDLMYNSAKDSINNNPDKLRDFKKN